MDLRHDRQWRALADDVDFGNDPERPSIGHTVGSLSHEEQLYRSIGEFIVSFQWIENKPREIDWFILDPAQ